MQKYKVRSMKIQTRLMVNFILMIIVIMSLSDMITYYQNMNFIMKDLKVKVCNMASAAALLVDADMIEAVQASNDMTGSEYIAIRDKLIEFQKDVGVAYIYTLAEDGSKTKFIVDGIIDEPAALGEPYDYMDGMAGAFKGIPTANSKLYSDEWGTFLSGYAPIKNDSGDIVAILCVDISVKQINELKYRQISGILYKLVIIISLFVINTIIICRRITKPIHLMDYKLRDLSTSGGDLTKTIDIHTGDEIESLANSVNEFIANIRCIISKASVTSEQVNAGASNLESSILQTVNVLEHNTKVIQAIAAGAANQGHDIDMVTHRVVDISAEITNSKNNLEYMKSTVLNSEEHISSGMDTVTELSIISEHNIKAFREVYQNINALFSDIKDIGSILRKISHVSAQINILALNASIEAARAGENGKGFSVVASEIKQLSANTAQSITEIDTILNRVFNDTELVNSQINVVNNTVSKQMDCVVETEKAFYGIQENVNLLINGVNQINQAFIDVSISVNDISDSMTAICEISQENAAITEELYASSEEQSATMSEIEETTKKLRIMCKYLDNTIEKFIL